MSVKCAGTNSTGFRVILFRYEARDNCTTIMRSYSPRLSGMKRGMKRVAAANVAPDVATAMEMAAALPMKPRRAFIEWSEW